MGLGTPDAAALIVCWQLECPMLPSASWTLMLPPVPSSSPTNICMFGGTSTELRIAKRHLYTHSHDEHDWHLHETNPTAQATSVGSRVVILTWLNRRPSCAQCHRALSARALVSSRGIEFLCSLHRHVLQWRSRGVVVPLWLLQT